VQRKGVKKV